MEVEPADYAVKNEENSPVYKIRAHDFYHQYDLVQEESVPVKVLDAPAEVAPETIEAPAEEGVSVVVVTSDVLDAPVGGELEDVLGEKLEGGLGDELLELDEDPKKKGGKRLKQ